MSGNGGIDYCAKYDTFVEDLEMDEVDCDGKCSKCEYLREAINE